MSQLVSEHTHALRPGVPKKGCLVYEYPFVHANGYSGSRFLTCHKANGLVIVFRVKSLSRRSEFLLKPFIKLRQQLGASGFFYFFRFFLNSLVEVFDHSCQQFGPKRLLRLDSKQLFFEFWHLFLILSQETAFQSRAVKVERHDTFSRRQFKISQHHTANLS